LITAKFDGSAGKSSEPGGGGKLFETETGGIFTETPSRGNGSREWVPQTSKLLRRGQFRGRGGQTEDLNRKSLSNVYLDQGGRRN